VPIISTQGQAATPSVRATPSLATDLSWLLMTASSPSCRTNYLERVDANPPAASMCGGAALAFDESPDLAERVRTFWGDTDEETSLTEVQILAHHAGAFDATDPDELWPALERAVSTVSVDLDIPSESEDDLRLFSDRLRRLKKDPALVRSYLKLLAEVWAPVDDMWQQWLPAMEQAGRHFMSQYERRTSLDLLITPGCDIFRERLPQITSDIDAGKQTDFVPCLFFGSSLYLDFPDLVVIGIRVGPGGEEVRARTESVARRLKAVADPTRLAILHSLAAAPSSVGELATLFRLAQPTVSMHVKVLRESGLVHSERLGGRLRLSADPGAVESLLGDLRDAVLQGTTPDQTLSVAAG
jgi:DNA-binding transcriptional ArsR family regulator